MGGRTVDLRLSAASCRRCGRDVRQAATIQQLEVDEITCWHIELDAPDLVISNGLPTESYVDVGNRTSFAGWESSVAGLLLDEAAAADLNMPGPGSSTGA